MRARGVSLVPCLAVAVPALGLESADHHLDREYYPHVHCLASAHAWASVGASWLGHVARIWIGSNRGRNYRASTLQQTGGGAVLHRLGICCECVQKLLLIIRHSTHSFPEEGLDDSCEPR